MPTVNFCFPFLIAATCILGLFCSFKNKNKNKNKNKKKLHPVAACPYLAIPSFHLPLHASECTSTKGIWRWGCRVQMPAYNSRQMVMLLLLCCAAYNDSQTAHHTAADRAVP